MTHPVTDSTEPEATPETARPRTVEEWTALYKAEFEAAQSALFSAMNAYTEALKKHHGFLKWREGFSDGWKASLEHFREQAAKEMDAHAHAGIAGLAAFSDINITSTGLAVSPPPMMPTANELVLQFITENPGKRGIEIADNFNKTVWQLPERTVRTALHRLKRAEKIKIVDGRWYAAEAAPADPQLAMQE